MFGDNSRNRMSEPDALREANIGLTLYSKPGYALARDEVLGRYLIMLFKLILKDGHINIHTPWDFQNNGGK